MAIVFDAPINIPAMRRLVLTQQPRFVDGAVIIVLDVRSAVAGGRSKRFELVVRDGGPSGRSDMLIENLAATGFDDALEVKREALEVTNGAQLLEAGMDGKANRTARMVGIEQALLGLREVQQPGDPPPAPRKVIGIASTAQ